MNTTSELITHPASETVSARDCLVVTRGHHPGARIAIADTTTVIGEHGKQMIKVERQDQIFTVSAVDATILVTHNGDPLPPVPKQVKHQDILRFADTELMCVLSTPLATQQHEDPVADDNANAQD